MKTEQGTEREHETKPMAAEDGEHYHSLLDLVHTCTPRGTYRIARPSEEPGDPERARSDVDRSEMRKCTPRERLQEAGLQISEEEARRVSAAWMADHMGAGIEARRLAGLGQDMAFAQTVVLRILERLGEPQTFDFPMDNTATDGRSSDGVLGLAFDQDLCVLDLVECSPASDCGLLQVHSVATVLMAGSLKPTPY